MSLKEQFSKSAMTSGWQGSMGSLSSSSGTGWLLLSDASRTHSGPENSRLAPNPGEGDRDSKGHPASGAGGHSAPLFNVSLIGQILLGEKGHHKGWTNGTWIHRHTKCPSVHHKATEVYFIQVIIILVLMNLLTSSHVSLQKNWMG